MLGLYMRTIKENAKTKGKAKENPDLKRSTHPCASTSPRNRLVELLWSFAPAFQRWSESLMPDKRLSPQRLRILGSLYERGPRIMSDLKEELGVTATNITALVDSLEKDGLVVRRSHPTDRRATVIELLPKAKSEMALGCTGYKNRVAELFSDLSEGECKDFTKTLEKLWNRLQQ
jgi:DNA-binding MarR family transcriptional regulator